MRYVRYESTNTLVDLGALVIREARPQRPRPPGPDTEALATGDCAPISPVLQRRLRNFGNLGAATLGLLQLVLWLSLVPWFRSLSIVIVTSRLTFSALGWLAYLLPAVVALLLLARRTCLTPVAERPANGFPISPLGRLLAVWFTVSVVLEVAAPGGGGGVVGAAVLASLRVLTGVPAVATLLALAGAASAGWWVASGRRNLSRPGLDRTRSELDTEFGLPTPISCAEPDPSQEPTDRLLPVRVRKVTGQGHHHPVQAAATKQPSVRPAPTPEEFVGPAVGCRASFGDVLLAK